MIVLPEDKSMISKLPLEDARQLLLALFSEDIDMPELSPLADLAYTVIKDKNNRISKKQSENGKRGGRPNKPTETQKSQPNPEKPTKAKKASVTVTVTDTVTEPNNAPDMLKHITPKGGSHSPVAAKCRFVKPSVQEVDDYCRKRNNGVNAEQFIDFYDAKGWIVGKVPMKDWQAAVRTWERNGIDRKPTSRPRGSPVFGVVTSELDDMFETLGGSP